MRADGVPEGLTPHRVRMYFSAQCASLVNSPDDDRRRLPRARRRAGRGHAPAHATLPARRSSSRSRARRSAGPTRPSSRTPRSSSRSRRLTRSAGIRGRRSWATSSPAAWSRAAPTPRGRASATASSAAPVCRAANANGACAGAPTCAPATTRSDCTATAGSRSTSARPPRSAGSCRRRAPTTPRPWRNRSPWRCTGSGAAARHRASRSP